MKYLLKIKVKSKYFGFHKFEYIEFKFYEDVMNYVTKKKINYKNYEVYAKINL